jgi:glycosyltransferase involved in cell wall biosynthesis
LPPHLSIVIPAHNEEQRLPGSLTRILEHLRPQPYRWEVLVVENGSRDGTAAVAERFAREVPGVRVLREGQRGKGLAVRRGMLEAAGDYRFICDADLSMPIDQIDRFLPPMLEDYDIAIASREAPGAVRYGEPPHRHWIGRIFNWIVRLLAVPGFQDTQCGFKCFRAEAAEALFPLQRLQGWTFDVELLFVAVRRGYRVVEVPIPWHYNPGSRVSLLRDSLAMFTDLFRIRRNWSRGLYAQEAAAERA